jgi:hypothetical protein
MRRTSKGICSRKRKTINKKIKLTDKICINKVSRKQQHKVWRPGELKKIGAEQQQGSKTDRQIQHRVWDPGGLQQMELMIKGYVHFGFRICALWLLYMHIYGSQNAHIRKLYIRKRAFVYAHYSFRKCAYTKDKMCIYGRELPHMHIYGRKKCAYTEAKMCIYGSQNMHI